MLSVMALFSSQVWHQIFSYSITVLHTHDAGGTNINVHSVSIHHNTVLQHEVWLVVTNNIRVTGIASKQNSSRIQSLPYLIPSYWIENMYPSEDAWMEWMWYTISSSTRWNCRLITVSNGKHCKCSQVVLLSLIPNCGLSNVGRGLGATSETLHCEPNLACLCSNLSQD